MGITRKIGGKDISDSGQSSQPRYQIKTDLPGNVNTLQNPGSPVTVWTFNLIPGKTYRVTVKLGHTVLTPSGYQSSTIRLVDSGNDINPSGVCFGSDTRGSSYHASAQGSISSGAWIGPGDNFLSEIVTMNPSGTGILSMNWSYSGSNGSWYLLGYDYGNKSFMSVEEITAIPTNSMR